MGFTFEEDKITRARQDSLYLTGKLLLAMPIMQDPRFEKSVVYMCAHNEEGAMGLVINRPMEGIDFQDLLEQLDMLNAPPVSHMSVNLGGPVEPARGFIMHSTDVMREDTMEIAENIGITASLDILQEIAEGRGPKNSLFMLGYAGWGPGQLESELQQNAWLTIEADEAIIFDPNPDAKWNKALDKLGINPAMLSATAGNA